MFPFYGYFLCFVTPWCLVTSLITWRLRCIQILVDHCRDEDEDTWMLMERMARVFVLEDDGAGGDDGLGGDGVVHCVL